MVAIIDTGIDYTHPDLAANIFINTAEIPGNHIDDDGNGFVDDVRGWDFVNRDNDPMDDHFHGTHVAGTVGAVGDNGLGVAGVNWSVRLMPLKFLDSGGSGSTADAVAAIEYATMMHVDVMSNSWGGGGFSEALRLAIENAMNAGILFVAAAGNSSSNNDLFPAYPASYDLDNIVSVASTTATDNLSNFSNFGPTTVDLAAPGSNILSTLPGSTYGLLSGSTGGVRDPGAPQGALSSRDLPGPQGQAPHECRPPSRAGGPHGFRRARERGPSHRGSRHDPALSGHHAARAGHHVEHHPDRVDGHGR